ncbi:MAG: hypothetical protein WDW38_005066 [Sanguina aurantia]
MLRAGVDRGIKVWNLESLPATTKKNGTFLKCESEFPSTRDPVLQIAWSPKDPNIFASIANSKSDLTLSMHAVGGQSWIGSVQEFVSIFSAVDLVGGRWTRRAETTASQDGHMQRLDELQVQQVLWGPTPNHLTYSTHEGKVHILSYPTFESVWELRAHNCHCFCIAFSPSSGTTRPKWMATGGMDATVTLWDMESLVCVRTVSATDSAVHTLSFSHDCKYLAFSGDANNSHTVEVLDIASGELLPALPVEVHTAALMWSPVCHQLVYCYEEPPPPPPPPQPSQQRDDRGWGGHHSHQHQQLPPPVTQKPSSHPHGFSIATFKQDSS